MSNLTKVNYTKEQLRPEILSLCAYFTCFVDFEHSGKAFNLSTVHKDDELAIFYFGGWVGDVVSVAGGQTKNLYKLVEFITDNNLWATIKRERNRKTFYRQKLNTDKRFSDVIKALRELNDPELNECIRTYRFFLFSVAYTAVGEVGHEKLMKMQPGTAGRLAYGQIQKMLKKSKRGIIKRISMISVFILMGVVLYNLLASGFLLTI